MDQFENDIKFALVKSLELYQYFSTFKDVFHDTVVRFPNL